MYSSNEIVRSCWQRLQQVCIPALDFERSWIVRLLFVTKHAHFVINLFCLLYFMDSLTLILLRLLCIDYGVLGNFLMWPICLFWKTNAIFEFHTSRIRKWIDKRTSQAVFVTSFVKILNAASTIIIFLEHEEKLNKEYYDDNSVLLEISEKYFRKMIYTSLKVYFIRNI